MNCNEFHTKLHAYFLGQLTEEARPSLDAHTAQCAECNDLMDTALRLTCREFIEFLCDYLDHTLPPERAAIFDEHLSICPDCTNYLETYKKTMQLSVAAMPDVLREIPEGLVRAILAAREAGRD